MFLIGVVMSRALAGAACPGKRRARAQGNRFRFALTRLCFQRWRLAKAEAASIGAGHFPVSSGVDK
ncbi:hypothetical protein CIT26_29615 [Mesorhizobium temperatum]|uniref:Uncharacterized protein n=1 Tax=Mesorhizobium temperatum TaxID=241416 RepID=A0A271LBN6_9HYPH|nr:hypothetical protein CIT26_29615 [Mesorhizobium temperatum]